MFISARDQARLGLLGLNKGKWDGKTDPVGQMGGDGTHAHRTQSRLWLLQLVSQHRQENVSGARADSFVAFIGDGANIIFIDYQHDIVAVVRWIDDAQKAEFVARLEAAITDRTAPGAR